MRNRRVICTTGVLLAAVMCLGVGGCPHELSLFARCVTLTPDQPSVTITVNSGDTEGGWRATCLHPGVTVTPATGTEGATAVTISADDISRLDHAKVLFSNPDRPIDAQTLSVTIAGGRAAGLWQSVFGGPGYAYGETIAPAADGGFFVGGAESDEMLIAKTDTRGAPLWKYTFANERARYTTALCATTDGGCIAGGGGYIDEYWESVLIRFDSAGGVTWQSTLPDMVAPRAILPHASGGYAVLTASTHLIKIDEAGNIEWEKPVFDQYCGERVSIAPTGDGGFAVLSCYGRLRKLDANGDLVWETVVTAEADSPRAVLALTDGGFVVVTSQYVTVNGALTVYYYATTRLTRLDVDGNILSTHEFCAPGRGELFGGICVTSDGQLILGGRAYHRETILDILSESEHADSISRQELFGHPLSSFVRKTDLDGNEIWQRTLVGSVPIALAPTEDGGAAVLGTFGTSPITQNGIYLVEITADGSALPFPAGAKLANGWQMRN